MMMGEPLAHQNRAIVTVFQSFRREALLNFFEGSLIHKGVMQRHSYLIFAHKISKTTILQSGV
jgi:hypothetical protein